jgi:hypothetical protein
MGPPPVAGGFVAEGAGAADRESRRVGDKTSRVTRDNAGIAPKDPSLMSMPGSALGMRAENFLISTCMSGKPWTGLVGRSRPLPDRVRRPVERPVLPRYGYAANLGGLATGGCGQIDGDADAGVLTATLAGADMARFWIGYNRRPGRGLDPGMRQSRAAAAWPPSTPFRGYLRQGRCFRPR